MCEGIESTEMKDVYHAPYERDEQLIGANPCTRGPAYWCDTVENAVDCNVRKLFPFSTCTRQRIVIPDHSNTRSPYSLIESSCLICVFCIFVVLVHSC